MRISGIGHAVPSQRITNDWVLECVRDSARTIVGSAEAAMLEHRLATFFAGAGTDVRYRLAPGEKAIDLAVAAGRRALAQAEVSAAEVDLLIYASVARGWLEPAMATVIQDQLGMSDATSFDVLDACAGWMRALQVANAYLRNGTYRCILIINCECGSPVYDDWNARSAREYEDRFASWTIGEAAAATVVTAEGDEPHFRFKTRAEHFDLCLFPLTDTKPWLPSDRTGPYEPMRLYTRSRELLTIATREIVASFAADPALCNRHYNIGFGHAASDRVVEAIIRSLNLPRERFVPTHARFGNTVSASIPLGMSVARDEGRLNRGDDVLAVVGAAGVTIGLAAFRF